MEISEEKPKKNVPEKEKVKIYINIEPLGLKFGTVFKKTETFQSVINFVFNQVKKLGVKFELGRINENKTGAIMLIENLIGDFLQNDDEITVYSDEYGFTRSNFPGEDDHSSLKKIYYLKSVSDLYKSMNFLKKKRNEKQKNKINQKKNNKEKENKEENDTNESKDEKEQTKEKENEKEKEQKPEISKIIPKTMKKNNETKDFFKNILSKSHNNNVKASPKKINIKSKLDFFQKRMPKIIAKKKYKTKTELENEQYQNAQHPI